MQRGLWKIIRKLKGNHDSQLDLNIGDHDLLKESFNDMTNTKGKFEIYKDKKEEFRFRLKAPNGEIIAVSEGYSTKQNAQKGVEAIKHYAFLADVIEVE